jgi:RNA polymerase sigma-70 factor (ECF subfamily)
MAESLIDRYGGGIYRLALYITGVGEDAEAVTRDALRAAANRMEMFPPESGFDSWVYRIAAQAAYQRARGRQPNPEAIALDDVLPSLNDDDWSHRVDDGALEGELRQVLTDAIDALPPDYRTVLVLHDVEGMSQPDIAETLGISPSGVKTRVHRSRLFVRQQLTRYLTSV